MGVLTIDSGSSDFIEQHVQSRSVWDNATEISTDPSTWSKGVDYAPREPFANTVPSLPVEHATGTQLIWGNNTVEVLSVPTVPCAWRDGDSKCHGHRES